MLSSRVLHRSTPLFTAWTVCAVAAAQNQNTGVTLTYIPGSSVKIEQLIGDFDYADAVDYAHPVSYVPTANQTVTQCHVAGTGLGFSFEHRDKLIFLFGDTISEDPGTLNYHAHDTIAWSPTVDPDSSLMLTFYTSAPNTPLFISPPGIHMGADEIANSGISVGGQIFLICNTGADTNEPDPHVSDYSVLARFDEATQTFTTGRLISQLHPRLRPNDPEQGHFIFNSPHAAGDQVLMFGVGHYRASDIYLSTVPASDFESGTSTRYFAGLSNGQPTWSDQEHDCVPIILDNPNGAPPSEPWPHDNPTIGNLSASYSSELGLWLVTYDGGRQPGPNQDATQGVYFTYAKEPWGPWRTPQLIFNGTRDHGYGVFMSDYDPHHPNIPGVPAGPTIGASNDPYHTKGGDFAPQMIERFTRVRSTPTGPVLSIYYTMSTWNPYTVLKMRSDFAIG